MTAVDGLFRSTGRRLKTLPKLSDGATLWLIRPTSFSFFHYSLFRVLVGKRPCGPMPTYDTCSFIALSFYRFIENPIEAAG